MTTHHSLSRDNSGNGVSCRVEACRRRLRTIRTNQKVLSDTVDVLKPISLLERSDETHSNSPSESVFVRASLGELEEAGIT